VVVFRSVAVEVLEDLLKAPRAFLYKVILLMLVTEGLVP